MNKALIIFATIVASVLAARRYHDAGPAGMLEGAVCQEVGEKHVDSKNMCWYHECVVDAEYGGLRAIGRRCALGSKLSYNFIHGFFNPCTINFDSTFGYECMREKPSVDGPPACFNDLVCYNGGSKTFEADKCWCVCPLTWQGDWDCSKPTRDVTDLPPQSDICVGGEPLDDWCRLAGGCEDGGTCYNQCDTFWCDCPNHLTYNYLGKRCEIGYGNADQYQPDEYAEKKDPAPYQPDAAHYQPESAHYQPDPAPYQPESASYQPDPVYKPEPAPYQPDAMPYQPDEKPAYHAAEY